MNQGLSIILSIGFLQINSSIFPAAKHGFRYPCAVVRDRAGFFENNLFAPKMDQKLGFFEFIGKLSCYIFLNLVYNESLFYFLWSFINHIFGENLVPEIWDKMLLANQFPKFLNKLYLQNKMMKKANFLHSDTNSGQLKVD